MGKKSKSQKPAPVMKQADKIRNQAEESPKSQVKKSKARASIYWNKKAIIEFFLFSVIIVVVGYLFYMPAKNFDLVFCDDNIFVLDYAQVNQNIDNIPKAFDKTIGTSYYRPILAISFILDAQTAGTKPWIYHQTNVLLHILGSLLVFIFLVKIGFPRIMSFIFGMIFALHPILTPAACWISGRNDSLITVFILLFFIFLILFLDNKKWYSWLFYLLNIIAFAFALFTKEIAAMIPFVSFMYILFYRQENKGAARDLWTFLKPYMKAVGMLGLYFVIIPKEKRREEFERSQESMKPFWLGFKKGMLNVKTSVIYITWFLIGLKWWSMRMSALEGIQNPDTIGFDALIKNFPTVPAMFGKIFLPVKMIALSSLEPFSIYTGIALMIIIAVLALFLKNVNKSNTLFGFFWFVIFLFPTLMVRIVYVDDFFDYAEHRAYLAMVGVIIIVMEIVRSFKVDFHKPLPIIISLIIIGAFFVRSYVYMPKFENRKTFWTQMIDMYPYKSRGYLDLGKAYYVEGDLTTAEKLYYKGVERNPDNFNLYIDLSAVYMRRSIYAKAEQFARKAVSLDKGNSIANYNLGKALMMQNKTAEALEPLETAC
ncbi:MAG: Tetratricopeptide repeat protein, partial [Bacteroidota bacterium]|nr:Tetratricopeptide repeat protein [Bacteroidota bacterium]